MKKESAKQRQDRLLEQKVKRLEKRLKELEKLVHEIVDAHDVTPMNDNDKLNKPAQQHISK
jgi:hypothetical protein